MHSVVLFCYSLNGGGDSEVSNSWCRELAGVQVGDVLHDLIEGVDVVALHGQSRLVRVELHLRGEQKLEYLGDV